ncbi:hypothetical protein HYW46_06220 [Candidatus Daviesbacteria bacterium]|nr:hypothetical protein [Candidatus Daviesbacteria bacterium]
MKKLLLVLFFSLCVFTFALPYSVYAQPVPAPPAAISSGQWQVDKEVTFTGKVAARSRDVLNWVIRNYEWSKVTITPNPFNAIWLKLSTLAYSLLALFILAAAFLLIITRGESITVRRFIPRFVLVLVLVYLSFALVQFLYQIADLIQGFFLNKPNNGGIIQAADLLNVSWDYDKFIGFRRFSPDGEFDESAIISLLLTKLTAATYYAMFVILIIRKVILWFLLVVSPIFPLLLFFSPVRNTAKIWVGEFFRWVLYGPLFAIFLAGLVALWSNGIGIPLDLNIPCKDFSKNEIVYPTSTNILLGGPCQQLAPEPLSSVKNVDQLNNLNFQDTFIQYLVALLMLWMVIIVPFILLKIFLDYLNTISLQDNNLVKYVLNAARPQRPGPAPVNPPVKPSPMPPVFPPSSTPPSSGYTGFARAISKTTGLAREIPRAIERGMYENRQALTEALRTANLSIPNLRDVAKLDSSFISGNIIAREQAHKLTESLKRVSGASTLTTPMEKEQFIKIKNNLVQEAGKGNPLASSIIEATKPAAQATLPVVNRVQTVNIEDYEEIKKTWEENYKTLEPPADENGNPRSRKQWLKDEVTKIPAAIEFLASLDPEQQRQGKEMVSKILPFLLLGGFSKEEVTAYLKAKLTAAKNQLSEEEKIEGEEFVEIEAKKEEKPKTMETEAAIPTEEKNLLGEQVPKIFPDQSHDKPVETIKIEEKSDDTSST